MSDPTDTDVIVCGAGAAGLTLAVDLARRGVAVRLVDKAEGPFPGSRGKGIQPRSQEVLEDLGVLERVLDTAGPYPVQRLYRADGGFDEATLSEAREPTSAEPYAAPLLSAQFLTERALRERLEALGGRVEFGTTLEGFEQDDAGVTVRLAGPGGTETLRCRYLVGADGGRSLVRHILGVAFPGATLGVRAVVADVRMAGLSDDAWHRWGEGAEQIALCPLSGTDLFQLQGPIPAEGDIDLSAESLTALVAARSGQRDLQVLSVAWASAYSMNARLADRYRVGRVFLAGDAAHIHPPTGGQGLNTSLQDSYNLGWKLAAVLGGAPEVLLDSYEAERRPVAAEVLGLSSRLLDAAKAGRAFKRGRETQQLDIGYPGSPLSLEGASREAGVQAGERAPDAAVQTAAGQTVRLFDVFQGPHWTLLGYETGAAVRLPLPAGVKVFTIRPDGDLRDAAGHVRDTYGLAPGDWALVRPDGYLAAVVGPAEVAALERYLEDVLGPRVAV